MLSASLAQEWGSVGPGLVRRSGFCKMAVLPDVELLAGSQTHEPGVNGRRSAAYCSNATAQLGQTAAVRSRSLAAVLSTGVRIARGSGCYRQSRCMAMVIVGKPISDGGVIGVGTLKR